MSVNKNDEFFEDMTPRVTGHILIRDPESGEVFVNKRDGNRPSRSNPDIDEAPSMDSENGGRME